MSTTRLVSGGGELDSRIVLWDLESGVEVDSVLVEEGKAVSCLAYHNGLLACLLHKKPVLTLLKLENDSLSVEKSVVLDCFCAGARFDREGRLWLLGDSVSVYASDRFDEALGHFATETTAHEFSPEMVKAAEIRIDSRKLNYSLKEIISERGKKKSKSVPRKSKRRRGG